MFRMVALWDTHTRSATAGSDTQVSGTLAHVQSRARFEAGRHGLRQCRRALHGLRRRRGRQTPARRSTFRRSVPVRIVAGAGGAPDTDQKCCTATRRSCGGQRTGARSGSSGRRPAARPAVQELDGHDQDARAARHAARRASSRAEPRSASATCHLIEVTDTSNPGQPDDRPRHRQLRQLTTHDRQRCRALQSGGRHRRRRSSPARIYNLGPDPQRNIWTVRADGTLTRSDAMRPASPPVDVAERVDQPQGRIRRRYRWRSPARCSGRRSRPPTGRPSLAVRTGLLGSQQQYETSIDPNTNVALAR